ncbi:Plasmodium exported protein, unknown function [Plasmodium relictum]|uniref:Plasmodium RESA N-terminal domain-containing protein n=1 Tax=Plasmodium relictum TaxID=85471 RepID=A0A1J1GL29_PLARL|nr:Plasmodium exported protein, unknown function [Plasmodium relictum]CRG85463.1 Plasmodium exported protein, unknown function [Plasmodium relictum]
MIYFIRSNGDLRKYILDSNSIITKSYPTNSYIDKRKTAKKKINIIPICLKLLTVLFLGLSCFFLECLFKKENIQISVPKFNKDHLRTLAEKESENINKLEYTKDSSSTITNSYPINSHINKGKTDKMNSNTTLIYLKLFTVLFLGFSYFFLERLLKKENMQISVSKFNKNHLKTLAEKESENINKLEYVNELYKKFKEDFKKTAVSLIRNVLENWEDMCYINDVRLSIYGRKWEQEKFEYLFSEILKDIKDIHNKISEEYRIFKKSYHTDKEYLTFFKKKNKDLNQFKKRQYEWTNKYEEKCRKEWKYLERLRNKKKSCNPESSCNQDNPRNLKSLHNPKTCPLKKLFQKK